MDILIGTGLAIVLGTCVAVFTGRPRRLRPHQAAGFFAIGNGLISIDDLLTGDGGAAVFSAAVTAWCAYHWWTGGGGDGTRRRLRALRRKFSGVRRTAPQPT